MLGFSTETESILCVYVCVCVCVCVCVLVAQLCPTLCNPMECVCVCVCVCVCIYIYKIMENGTSKSSVLASRLQTQEN